MIEEKDLPQRAQSAEQKEHRELLRWASVRAWMAGALASKAAARPPHSKVGSDGRRQTKVKRNGPWSDGWTWNSPERKIRFWDFLGSLAGARRTSERKQFTTAMIASSRKN